MSLNEEQDELIEKILEVLRPQLDGRQAVSPGQYRAMQEAVAWYTRIAQGETHRIEAAQRRRT
jgi:hypothetical protein